MVGGGDGGVPAGEPFQVPSVPRGTADVPGERDGVHPDEVDRGVRAGEVRGDGGEGEGGAATGEIGVADAENEGRPAGARAGEGELLLIGFLGVPSYVSIILYK